MLAEPRMVLRGIREWQGLRQRPGLEQAVITQGRLKAGSRIQCCQIFRLFEEILGRYWLLKVYELNKTSP